MTAKKQRSEIWVDEETLRKHLSPTGKCHGQLFLVRTETDRSGFKVEKPIKEKSPKPPR